MKEQIANRLGVAHVRDTVKQFVAGSVTRQQAMESLQIGQSRLYDLRTSYLAAEAAGEGETWEPGHSGGNHKPAWSDEEQRVLRRAQQAGAWGASIHPLQQQSEGEEDLKTKPEWLSTIPVLISTSFPVLKSTRHY